MGFLDTRSSGRENEIRGVWCMSSTSPNELFSLPLASTRRRSLCQQGKSFLLSVDDLGCAVAVLVVSVLLLVATARNVCEHTGNGIAKKM